MPKIQTVTPTAPMAVLLWQSFPCTIFYLIANGLFFMQCHAYYFYLTGLILVTDAIAPMGLPTGKHHIGTQEIEINGKRAMIAGTQTLCGR